MNKSNSTKKSEAEQPEIIDKTPLPWHQTSVEYFSRLINDNKLHHATMLREREGFYDDFLSHFACKLILCDNKNGTDECKHCQLMQQETHPNLIYLNAGEKVSIDDIRKVEQRIWQTSAFDKPKIIYLRLLDLLSINAQNALLKTLEEPPKNTFFIITILNKSDVLPTIISRLQYLQHKTSNTEDVVLWLQSTLGPDNTLSAVEISNVAKLANFIPEKSKLLLNDNNQIELIKDDKKYFAEFMTGRLSASHFTDKIIKTNVEQSLITYIGYIDLIIKDIFKKNLNSKDNENPSIRRNDWNGISQKEIFHLRDILVESIKLNKTNVNIGLQIKQQLMDWNNEREQYE